jgi:hypothetical protein
MNAKEIARRLEFIKYFTLKKSPIYLNTNADKNEQIQEKNIHLSDDISFNIESIVVDYGYYYNPDLTEKTIEIFFNKIPEASSVNFDTISNEDGLMTPAITNPYIDGNLDSFRRYIFPSESDYSYYASKKYVDWSNTTSIDVNKRDGRSHSMNILVPMASTADFEEFLNESLSHWQSRFNKAVIYAKEGNFDWFNLYDPKIYEYALSIEDRKSILDELVYSTNWNLTFDFLSVKYELFIALIKSANQDHSKELYEHMFEVYPLTGNTNLQGYEDKLPAKLYDELIRTLMSFFYFTKGEDVIEFMNDLDISRFYPIGLEMLGPWTIPLQTYYDLDVMHENGTGQYTRGVKYGIETINGTNLKIKIKSAIQYTYNPYLKRVEYKVFDWIGKNEEWNFDDIVFVSPYLANKEIKGLNIPHGSVIPIPAFALPWLVDRNKSTEDIFDLIEKAVTFAGVVFPVIKIVQGISVFYNALGIAFSLISNTLSAGLADQIQRFDESKSTPGHPYTKGQDFLGVYYLISAIYGGVNLGKAIREANGAKEKIKVFGEFETLWGIRGTIIDFNAYIDSHPEENIDSLNIIKNEMNLLDMDIYRFQFLKEKK